MSFQLIRRNHKVQLSPYYLLNVLEGIENNFNNKVMKYTDALGGIILSFDNIEIVGRLSHIVDDNPFLFVECEADFLILKIEAGQVIKGRVTQINNHGAIDLLVFNTLNATIRVNPEWKRNAHFKKWFLESGRVIQFEVASCSHSTWNLDRWRINGKLDESRPDHGVFDDEQNFVSITRILEGMASSSTSSLSSSNQSNPSDESDPSASKSPVSPVSPQEDIGDEKGSEIQEKRPSVTEAEDHGIDPIEGDGHSDIMESEQDEDGEPNVDTMSAVESDQEDMERRKDRKKKGKKRKTDKKDKKEKKGHSKKRKRKHEGETEEERAERKRARKESKKKKKDKEEKRGKKRKLEQSEESARGSKSKAKKKRIKTVRL